MGDVVRFSQDIDRDLAEAEEAARLDLAPRFWPLVVLAGWPGSCCLASTPSGITDDVIFHLSVGGPSWLANPFAWVVD